MPWPGVPWSRKPRLSIPSARIVYAGWLAGLFWFPNPPAAQAILISYPPPVSISQTQLLCITLQCNAHPSTQTQAHLNAHPPKTTSYTPDITPTTPFLSRTASFKGHPFFPMPISWPTINRPAMLSPPLASLKYPSTPPRRIERVSIVLHPTYTLHAVVNFNSFHLCYTNPTFLHIELRRRSHQEETRSSPQSLSRRYLHLH
jgi:hypothetical protein